VSGVGFRVQGSRFRVQGSGFRVQSSGFRVQGFSPFQHASLRSASGGDCLGGPLGTGRYQVVVLPPKGSLGSGRRVLSLY
jgi:hypothetical protein